MPKVNLGRCTLRAQVKRVEQVTAVHYVFVTCQVLERARCVASSSFLLVCPPGLLI